MALIRGTARTTEQVQEQYDAAEADLEAAGNGPRFHALTRAAVYGWALGLTDRAPVTGTRGALNRPALATEYLAAVNAEKAQGSIASKALQWLIGVEPAPPRLPAHAARA